MAGTKQKVETKDIIPKPMLIYKIRQMDSLRDRALACFIYMSGCRISEIVGTTKIVKHYIKEKGRYVTDENNKWIYDGFHEIEIKPLQKESIEYMEDKKVMLIHNVPCLKRLTELPKRNIPVFIPIVPEFFEIFWQYYKTLKDGGLLFPITRERAWQILKKKMGLYSHFLIHERLTHFTSQNDLSDQDLKLFRGWSSTVPATSYVHLRWQDLARKQGAKLDD